MNSIIVINSIVVKLTNCTPWNRRKNYICPKLIIFQSVTSSLQKTFSFFIPVAVFFTDSIQCRIYTVFTDIYCTEYSPGFFFIIILTFSLSLTGKKVKSHSWIFSFHHFSNHHSGFASSPGVRLRGHNVSFCPASLFWTWPNLIDKSLHSFKLGCKLPQVLL